MVMDIAEIAGIRLARAAVDFSVMRDRSSMFSATKAPLLWLSFASATIACSLPHSGIRPNDVNDVTTRPDLIDDPPIDDRPSDIVSEAVDVIDDQPDDVQDAGRDVSTDTDTGVDTGIDVRSDTGVDTGVDTGIDVRSDTGVDTGVDTGIDVPSDADACSTPCGTTCCRNGESCVDTECVSTSCAALFAANPSLPDGEYMVNPGGLPPVRTYCRFLRSSACDGGASCTMATGGWTLLMRSVFDYDGQTERLRTDYANFYNNAVGSAAPNSVYRMPGRYWPQFSALGGGRQEHLFVLTPRTSRGTDCAPMFFYVSNGRWQFTATGPGQITMVPAEGSRFFQATPGPVPFVTRSDDTTSLRCVTGIYSGVPWVYTSCMNFSPGFRVGTQFENRPRPMLADLESGMDLFGRTLSTSCGAEAPLRSTPEGYEVLSIAEYYIR
jgi:hypothetical protein